MSRPRPRPRIAVAAALLALAAAAPATASGPAKPAPETAPGAPVAAERGQSSGTLAPASGTLLVTFADAPGRAAAERRMRGLGRLLPVLPEAGVWGLRPDQPPAARARALARPAVIGAEWSLARESAERPRPPMPPPLGPAPAFADALFAGGRQWGLVSPRPVWGTDLTLPGPRPRIAILDSGVDGTHEEWGGPATPLVAPRSTVRNDADAADWGFSGHGTHVAGIAAAPANGVGIVGVAPARAGTAEVVPVQIADREGRSTDATMIRGIRHAVRNGARVVNISAGGPGYSRAFHDTVLWATQQGALIVASVGNEGQDLNSLNYPAAYPRVVGVGAQCDGVASPDCPRPFGPAKFSNRNRSVDVIAPGVNVLSSVPRRVAERSVAAGYALKDGTSMAAPYVAGVAALIQAANGNALSPHQVAAQIVNTATDVAPRGRDDMSGYGIVNPRAAVTLRPPADDVAEVNDDVKWLTGAKRLAARRPQVIRATIDRDRDPDDVYAVFLRRGDRLRATLSHRRGVLDLYLWGPGTRTVTTSRANLRRNLIAFRGGRTPRTKAIVHRAERTGRYYVNVFARRGAGEYRLAIRRG